VQILHPFVGSIQRYSEELSDPDRYRPDHCPQCEANRPLRAHGFYQRTLVNIAFDGTIRVRRYLCCCCKRTLSLLPEFALPYLRFGIVVIALFLVARLFLGLTLKAAAEAARLAVMPYQRGQFWVRRFRQEAQKLCAALAALIAPPEAADFASRSSDVGVDRLDRSPPVSVCRPPCPPARLAGVSRSGRAHRGAAAGDAVRLNWNTELLHGENGSLDRMLWLWRSPRGLPRWRYGLLNRGESEKPAGKHRENVGGEDRGALHA